MGKNNAYLSYILILRELYSNQSFLNNKETKSIASEQQMRIKAKSVG
jgi:hypothetical protein